MATRAQIYAMEYTPGGASLRKISAIGSRVLIGENGASPSGRPEKGKRTTSRPTGTYREQHKSENGPGRRRKKRIAPLGFGYREIECAYLPTKLKIGKTTRRPKKYAAKDTQGRARPILISVAKGIAYLTAK